MDVNNNYRRVKFIAALRLRVLAALCGSRETQLEDDAIQVSRKAGKGRKDANEYLRRYTRLWFKQIVALY